MSNAKAKLIDAVNTLPEGIENFLEAGFPEAPTIPTPTTVEEAIQATGICSDYMLKLFGSLAGFAPVAALMHLGQKNTVNQVMMLASLQVVKAAPGGDYDIITPTPGGVYYGYCDEFEIVITDGQAVSVQGVGQTQNEAGEWVDDPFDLTENPEQPGHWTANWVLPLGQHTIAYTVTFAKGEPVSKDTSFDVRHYPTVPEEGDTLPTTFEIQLDPEGQDVESVEAILTDEEGTVLKTFNLMVDSVQGFWTWEADELDSLIVIGPEGVGLGMVFRVLVVGQLEIYQKSVNFIVNAIS